MPARLRPRRFSLAAQLHRRRSRRPLTAAQAAVWIEQIRVAGFSVDEIAVELWKLWSATGVDSGKVCDDAIQLARRLAYLADEVLPKIDVAVDIAKAAGR